MLITNSAAFSPARGFSPQLAPIHNPNNFAPVGMQLGQTLLAAMLNGSNQLFAGFQAFGGGMAAAPNPGFGRPMGVVQTGQLLNAQFQHMSASLQHMQMQTASHT